MPTKRIKVSVINLVGPALIWVMALMAWQHGHSSFAVFAGILGAVTWVIGACTVRVIWRGRRKP